ncbi:HD domain-containing phosphohydrolase [Vibrio sp. SCSIO 43137]|uniref:HD domain-containing phosphohydrolase n=1 Tax=Vibrio sp. SCSIO 43137 TaxID=3021011 RepID=UPI002307688E|nr:HD domain-containing phosphohydrolase [Vibrio sp. SCSIO 43137]WCE31657.1 HD domain-containing protein [Vibrio sp. SCSIO 43137]
MTVIAITGSEYSESDMLNYLDSGTNIQQRVTTIRQDLVRYYPAIHRVAIALYDAERDVLKTYACDEDITSGLKNYEAVLGECESLRYLASSGRKRVVNDLVAMGENDKQHTALVRNAGYQSSLTMPLIMEGRLLGFLFANSREKHAFTDVVSKHMQMLSMFLTLLLNQDINRINILKSTIESMKIINQIKDPETAAHLNRMANYSLIIAREVADIFNLSDLKIGYIYLYAPLHDVGKLMVPDSVLFKEDKLTDAEFEVMKKHSADGEDLTRQILDVYKLSDVPFPDMLTAIVRSHHEKIDGSGYPDGLVGDDIPVEARIVAVADIFDALTSNRSYKQAWSIDDAFAELKRMSGTKLDAYCVEALLHNREKVIATMQSFVDTPLKHGA